MLTVVDGAHPETAQQDISSAQSTRGVAAAIILRFPRVV